MRQIAAAEKQFPLRTKFRRFATVFRTSRAWIFFRAAACCGELCELGCVGWQLDACCELPNEPQM